MQTKKQRSYKPVQCPEIKNLSIYLRRPEVNVTAFGRYKMRVLLALPSIENMLIEIKGSGSNSIEAIRNCVLNAKRQLKKYEVPGDPQ